MQVQWLHRFESVQKHFVKISATHVIAFAKDVALSERAVDTIPREIRLNILKRILKYVRQQKVQEEKQAESSGYVLVLSYTFSHNSSYGNAISSPAVAVNMQSVQMIVYLFWIPRTPHIDKIYCLAFKVKNQSLAGESFAVFEPCTVPLHCVRSSKLKIRLLRMLLDFLWGMPFSS